MSRMLRRVGLTLGFVFGVGVFSVSASAFAAPPPASGVIGIDGELPEYRRSRRGVEGELRSIGSDTLGNVMKGAGLRFVEFYPGVKIEVEDKGSSTAPPALIQGQAQFGPMSRPMKRAEIEAFEKAFGYKPTRLDIGIDCLAVFVHKDNPVRGLTMEQVRDIFSAGSADLTWGDVGVTDPVWSKEPIRLYGRNSASGTYDFFKKHALRGDDFKNTVKESPGSSGVIQTVSGDRFGMGYSGIGYKTAGVRAVPIIGSSENDPRISEPTLENALAGEYPLARFLVVYVNYDEVAGLDRLRREFIRFVFSRQGQEVVLQQGYFPLPAAIAREQLSRVGIEPGF